MQPKAAGINILNNMSYVEARLFASIRKQARFARRLFEALLSRTRFAQTLGSINLMKSLDFIISSRVCACAHRHVDSKNLPDYDHVCVICVTHNISSAR